MTMAVAVAGVGGDVAVLEAAVEAFCSGFDAGVVTASEAAAVVERRVTAVRACAARRVDASSMWRQAGHRNAAEWMASRTGDPVSVAHGLLVTARTVEGCRATADAFAAGAVSMAAAREIADAVAVDPSAEAGLLAVAAAGDHRALVDRAARVRQAARSVEDDAARHARLRARRFLRTRTDADGLVILHAGFAPADWARVAAKLQRATDATFAGARRAGRREPVEAYAADAFVALCDPVPTGDEPKPSARPEVTVLVDGIALKRGHVRAGERCEIIGVGPVSIDWVNQLLPESIVHALIHNGVDITTYASATRSIRKAVKVAVHARDRTCVVRTCVVRGCHQSRRTQRDHRTDYAFGGPGSTTNLELLCEFHHNQKTRDGARLERRDDHWHWHPPHTNDPWVTPVGTNLTLWDTDTS